jgi:diadenosine tetraphosphate (Ap4A) HIT family hydrolase
VITTTIEAAGHLYDHANARNEEQAAVMRGYEAAGWCLFCHAPADDRSGFTAGFVTADGMWTVRPNRWPHPRARLHLVIAPLKHVTEAADCPEGLLAAVAAAEAEYGIRRHLLAVRSGPTALTGATVVHLHAQLYVGSFSIKARTPDAPAARPVTVAHQVGARHG